jgi:hypothetical protein
VVDDFCVQDAEGAMSVVVVVMVGERLVEVAAGEGGEVSVGRPAGEEKTFRPYDPEQVLLLAPVLSEWVREGDLAHFVSDLVETGRSTCRRSTPATRRSAAIRPTTRA